LHRLDWIKVGLFGRRLSNGREVGPWWLRLGGSSGCKGEGRLGMKIGD
jgi:hypothetical protein